MYFILLKFSYVEESGIHVGATFVLNMFDIKSYNEDALEKTIYQSVTQKEKSEDSR